MVEKVAGRKPLQEAILDLVVQVGMARREATEVLAAAVLAVQALGLCLWEARPLARQGTPLLWVHLGLVGLHRAIRAWRDVARACVRCRNLITAHRDH